MALPPNDRFWILE